MQITETLFERCDSMRLSKKKKNLPWGFILLSVVPSCVLLVLFVFYPMLKSATLSFQDVGLLSTSGPWVGLDNYAYLLKDEKFAQALVNTLKIMFVIPVVTILISFTLAVVLHRCKLPEKNLYVTIYFFPYFMSATVVSVVYSGILQPTSNGVLNSILSVLGLESWQRAWLGDKSTALWCIAAVLILCSIGYYVVLYLSGLDSISPDLYEAAKLDGASVWQQVWNITLPLMKNIIGTTFVLLMSGTIGGSFIYSKIMTNGGPNGASNVLLRYIYQQGVMNGNVGYSSAITVFTIVLAVILAVLSRTVTSRSEKE